MFLRVMLVVVCALGLLWAYGPKQERESKRKVTGTVTSAEKEGPQESLKRILSTQESVEKRLASIKVPTKMLKNGEFQQLSSEQRRNYAVLAVFFNHHPVMLRIAACESSLKHVDGSGQVVVGEVTPDVGVFQINPVHERELRTYRLDPRNFSHNVAFANYLFQRDGLRPWNSSRNCWETIRFA